MADRRRRDIRQATPRDIDALPEIERSAGQLFKTYPGDLGIPEEMYEQPNSVETFAAAQKRGRLWVATALEHTPIGFALVLDIDGYAHLEELDVLPAHQRQGIGSELLRVVCSWAKASGFPAVTLRTFRDVPWNAPFYLRRGFHIVENASLSPSYLKLEASERRRGLRTELRVTMAHTTAG
jgi:GNAT superfamily N-acetyltransferase